MTVGIDPHVLHAETFTDLLEAVGRPDLGGPKESERDFKAGSDGILVRLGGNWSDEKMMLQPQDR